MSGGPYNGGLRSDAARRRTTGATFASSTPLKDDVAADWRAFWGCENGPPCGLCTSHARHLSTFVAGAWTGETLNLDRFRCDEHREVWS